MIPVHEFYLTDDLGNRYLESGKFELQVGKLLPTGFISTFRCISVLPEREDRRCPVLFKSRTDGKVIQVKRNCP